MEPQSYRYRAFVSYSHRDEHWAKWLHRSVETYRVPKRLVGSSSPHGPVPARLAPVFRDRDELASATNLGDTLSSALQESQFLLVICSTASARSHWVNEEILTFKRLGREHRIFCLLVDGEPGASLVPGMAAAECFPPAMLYTIGADGQLTTTRSEPIAADVRPHKDGRSDALLKLVAGMLGVGLDHLKQREAHRRRQRMTLLLTASTAGMVVTSTLATTAWLQSKEANRQRVVAEEKAEETRRTAELMLGLFEVSNPSEALGNTITARDLLDRGAASIKEDDKLRGQPAIRAAMTNTIGMTYSNLGLVREAVPLLQEAVDLRRKLPGEHAGAIAESLRNLGITQTRKADYTEAEHSLREALQIRRRERPRSAEVAATLSSLAELLSARGEYAQGTPLIEEALQIRSMLFGAEHELVAESIGDLGQNLGERGEFQKAEVELRHALELQRKLRPDGHPALSEAVNNLAWALMNLGRAGDAELLYREALAMRRKVGDHLELAAALNNLAYARELRGDYGGAEAAYREALEMSRKRLGERHPDVATTMSNLAFAQYAQGKRRAAIEQLRTTLVLRREVLGARHPDVAGDAASLAYWLIDAGNLTEAGTLIEESLSIRRQQLGERHPSVATTLAVKASLQLAQRSYRAAAATAGEAEAILAPERDASHWQMAVAMNARGAALAGLGQFEEGEKLLRDSLPGLEGAPIPGLTAKGKERLRQLYLAWGKPERAEQYATP